MIDTATALDAIAGLEPGDHYTAPGLPISFVEAARRPPGPVPIRIALSAPLGVPIDREPRDAARRTAHALADLGHDVQDGTPDWDDQAFPSTWETFATGALQHIVRVLERLHERPVARELLEPATRAWLLDGPPVTLIDYLEAKERLIGFSRRVLATWPADGVLITPTLTRLPPPVAALQSRAGVTDDAVRLLRGWQATIAGAVVPIWISWIGLAIAAYLAYQGFRLARK